MLQMRRIGWLRRVYVYSFERLTIQNNLISATIGGLSQEVTHQFSIGSAAGEVYREAKSQPMIVNKLCLRHRICDSHDQAEPICVRRR